MTRAPTNERLGALERHTAERKQLDMKPTLRELFDKRKLSEFERENDLRRRERLTTAQRRREDLLAYFGIALVAAAAAGLIVKASIGVPEGVVVAALVLFGFYRYYLRAR